jgi:hypothetical protein
VVEPGHGVVAVEEADDEHARGPKETAEHGSRYLPTGSADSKRTTATSKTRSRKR